MKEIKSPKFIISKKEINWLIGTFSFILVVCFVVFGSKFLEADSTINFRIQDTYIGIPNYQFVILFSILVFFGVNLVRSVSNKFKNYTSSFILLVSIILLILTFTAINTIIDLPIQHTSEWTVYSPSDSKGIKPDIEQKMLIFGALSNIVLTVQTLLLILLVIIGFKIGRNSNKIEKNELE